MNQNLTQNRSQAFVEYIIDKIQYDKSFAASLRRADNPATEYQCWDLLAKFNIPLDEPTQRLPFVTIAAAIAKEKIITNGSTEIGRALATCYDDGYESEQAKIKMRRLFACSSTKEVCRILRPLFSLISSKSMVNLDYVKLLDDLLRFNSGYQLSIKSRWAQSFYGREFNEEEKG